MLLIAIGTYISGRRINMLNALYQRYRDIMTAAVARGVAHFTPQSEPADVISLDRGIAFPLALLNRPLGLVPASHLPIADRAGHRRPVFRPLLVYSLAQSFELIRRSLSEADVQSWKSCLAAWESTLPQPSRSVPPTEAAWTALARFSIGEREQAERFFSKMISSQQASGAFLTLKSGENPETNWYDELVVLHALASYAARSQNTEATQAVFRAGAYHMEETQPDHATSQPWGVHAFLWNTQTVPLADQVLHSAAMLNPGALDVVSMILLADAIIGLKALEQI